MIFEQGFIHRIPAKPSSTTAAAILAALLTVDGAGSGLDADLLDGQHGAFYTSYTDTAIANLLALPDPFPQYLTQVEGDARYSPIVHQHKLNDLQNPNADTLLTMGNNHLKLSFGQPIAGGGIDGAFELEATGAYTGDLLHIHQHTGTPVAGVDLVHLEAASINVLPLRIITSGASIAANITGRIDLTGTTGTAGARDFNLLTTTTSGTGGIRIKASSQNTDLATIELIGRRDNSNTSATFAGTIALAKHRTDTFTAINSRLGRIIFGANHTDGSEANILYGGMIAGLAQGALNSAVDFPIGIIFCTGTSGVLLTDTSETGELPIRLTIRADGTIVHGSALTFISTNNAVFAVNPVFQSDFASQQGFTNNVVFDPTSDSVITIHGQHSGVTIKKQFATTPISQFNGFNTLATIDAANLATITALAAYRIQGIVNNSAVAVTNTYGYYCPNLTVGSTIQAFYGNLSAAAGKWNLYMAGTAINHMLGALLLGTTTDDGVNKLQVNGSVGIQVNNGIKLTNQVSGAAAQAGTLGNSPVAGDPAFWVPITVNGTTRYIPTW